MAFLIVEFDYIKPVAEYYELADVPVYTSLEFDILDRNYWSYNL